MTRDQGGDANTLHKMCLAEIIVHIKRPGLAYRWEGLANEHGDILAVMDPHHSPATRMSFRELNGEIQQFAAGLAELGLSKGDKVILVLICTSKFCQKHYACAFSRL